MQSGTFSMLSGEVEVDETYIGGKARHMHKAQRKQKVARGRAPGSKTIILGMAERGGRVSASVVEDVTKRTVQSYVRDRVKPGSSLYTDEFVSYTGLNADFDHRTVNHVLTYVDGNVHTNVMENFWSVLKRGLNGTYISVKPFHLFRYLDERMFTFNERELDDLGRFEKVVGAVSGRRLTYARVTGSYA
jgi:transposase-like protein